MGLRDRGFPTKTDFLPEHASQLGLVVVPDTMDDSCHVRMVTGPIS